MVDRYFNWSKEDGNDTPRVLLIAEYAQGSSHMIKHLEERRCKCSFAASYQEAVALCDTQDFDLVLSPMRLGDASVFPLVSRLDGSGTYLFYYQSVEEGCWWLPALRDGQKCFGSDALRPSDFAIRLEQIIGDIRTRLRVVAKSVAATPPAKAVVPARSPAPINGFKPLRADRAGSIKQIAAR
jgi:hypothetical protein